MAYGIRSYVYRHSSSHRTVQRWSLPNRTPTTKLEDIQARLGTNDSHSFPTITCNKQPTMMHEENDNYVLPSGWQRKRRWLNNDRWFHFENTIFGTTDINYWWWCWFRSVNDCGVLWLKQMLIISSNIIWDSCWRCSQWPHIWVMIKIRHIIHSSHSSWTSTIESLLVCVVVASEYIFRVKSTAISNERISANVMNNYHRTDVRPFNSEKPLSITNPKTISMMRINQFSLWKQICDKRACQSCH